MARAGPFLSLPRGQYEKGIKSMPFVAVASSDGELASKTQSPRLIGGGVTLDTQVLAAKSAPWALGKRARQLIRASFCSERSSWSGFLPNNTGQ